MNPIRPWRDVKGAGLTKIEQHRSGLVKQGEHLPWAVGGEQVEIRLAEGIDALVTRADVPRRLFSDRGSAIK